MDFAMLLGTLDGWSGNAAGLAQEAAHQDFSGHGLVKRMELAGRMVGRHGAFDDSGALQQLILIPPIRCGGLPVLRLLGIRSWVSPINSGR